MLAARAVNGGSHKRYVADCSQDIAVFSMLEIHTDTGDVTHRPGVRLRLFTAIILSMLRRELWHDLGGTVENLGTDVLEGKRCSSNRVDAKIT